MAHFYLDQGVKRVIIQSDPVDAFAVGVVSVLLEGCAIKVVGD